METEELKPGEKKCTETAHNGADAYFDYKVTYPTGEVKSECEMLFAKEIVEANENWWQGTTTVKVVGKVENIFSLGLVKT